MTKNLRKSALDRKSEIERAALALAFDVGPDRLTTGMVARQMNLTQPAIYKHFRCKDDIWLAVAETLSARIIANISHNTLLEQTGEKRLFSLVHGQLKLIEEFPALPEIMVMREIGGQTSVFQTKVRQAMNAFYQALVENVRTAQTEKIFKAEINADDVATLILGVIQSLALRMIVSRDTSILLANGENLLKLQLAGFRRQGTN